MIKVKEMQVSSSYKTDSSGEEFSEYSDDSFESHTIVNLENYFFEVTKHSNFNINNNNKYNKQNTLTAGENITIVNDMTSMFSRCSNLKSIVLPNFNKSEAQSDSSIE